MLTHPQFDPIALAIGPVAFHWYGLMYAVAFLAFVWVGKWQVRRMAAWPEPWASRWLRHDPDDMLVWGMLGVVLGGRLGYVLFYQPAFFADNPMKILAVWEGGMSFHGGLLGVLLALAWYARRRGLTFPDHPHSGDVMTQATVTTEPAARAVGAKKYYGEGDTEVRALDDVDVEFERGKFTAIMGPSGSGKSTLMHCQAGLDTLTGGQVFIGDTDLSSLGERELTLLRRDNVGFIFQAFNLVPTLSALENITLPMDLAGIKPDQAWLDEVITTVGLADRVDHRPNELSGGQQQRVAVSRALASRPEIIFADEPTGNLDSTTGTEILAFMRKAVDDLGQTIVMVTHDPVAAAYADRVIFLADGKIVDELLDPDAEQVIDQMKKLR